MNRLYLDARPASILLGRPLGSCNNGFEPFKPLPWRLGMRRMIRMLTMWFRARRPVDTLSYGRLLEHDAGGGSGGT